MSIFLKVILTAAIGVVLGVGLIKAKLGSAMDNLGLALALGGFLVILMTTFTAIWLA